MGVVSYSLDFRSLLCYDSHRCEEFDLLQLSYLIANDMEGLFQVFQLVCDNGISSGETISRAIVKSLLKAPFWFYIYDHLSQ